MSRYRQSAMSKCPSGFASLSSPLNRVLRNPEPQGSSLRFASSFKITPPRPSRIRLAYSTNPKELKNLNTRSTSTHTRRDSPDNTRKISHKPSLYSHLQSSAGALTLPASHKNFAVHTTIKAHISLGQGFLPCTEPLTPNLTPPSLPVSSHHHNAALSPSRRVTGACLEAQAPSNRRASAPRVSSDRGGSIFQSMTSTRLAWKAGVKEGRRGDSKERIR